MFTGIQMKHMDLLDNFKHGGLQLWPAPVWKKTPEAWTVELFQYVWKGNRMFTRSAQSSWLHPSTSCSLVACRVEKSPQFKALAAHIAALVSQMGWIYVGKVPHWQKNGLFTSPAGGLGEALLPSKGICSEMITLVVLCAEDEMEREQWERAEGW